MQRFCYDIQATGALLLGSDTLFIRPIDNLLDSVERSCAIAGLVAQILPSSNARGDRLSGTDDDVAPADHSHSLSIQSS
jgi:hypothetical protein